MKKLLLAIACLLPFTAAGQSIPVPTKNGQAGGVPAAAGDPLFLNQMIGFFGEKCDTNASGCTVAPTGIGGSPRTLADTLGQVLSPSWLAPAYLASALGGVVANDGTDQSDHINKALSAIIGGATILMPCGISYISKSLLIPRANARTTLASANRQCSTIVAMNTFLGGAVVTGSISGTTLTLASGAATTSRAINSPVTGLGSTLVLPDTVITGVISSSQYAVSQPQTIASETMLIGGDMLDIIGPGSGVRSLAFDVQQTSAQASSGDTPFRTSGYTVNLLDNDQFVEDFFMSSCFICIRDGAGAGKTVIRNGVMQFIADGTSNPGSGGVLVENTGPGPENDIESTYIYPNLPGLGGGPTLYHPTFGYKLTNTGATHLRGNDVTQANYDLLIAPGNGQTVQATKSSDDVFDAGEASCVNIAPTGTGYVFDTTFTSPWCTSQATNINGVTIAGSDASAETAQPFPIMKTKFLGGLIALASPAPALAGGSAAGQSGTGFLVADAYSSDTTLADTTINGWLYGVFVAAGASHISLHHNFIGNYGFFGVGSRTNYVGINVAGGSGDDIEIDDNHLVGNTGAPLGFAATGGDNRVHDNPGYNPVGPKTLTASASPWTIPGGPTEDDLYFNAGTLSSVTLANPGQAGVTVCSASPCFVRRAPYQAAVVTYGGTAPTVVQNVH